jgi:hypothetical protein
MVDQLQEAGVSVVLAVWLLGLYRATQHDALPSMDRSIVECPSKRGVMHWQYNAGDSRCLHAYARTVQDACTGN